MNKEALKQKAVRAIDENANQIIKIGDDLWKLPEVGYREYKTAEYVESQYDKMLGVPE